MRAFQREDFVIRWRGVDSGFVIFGLDFFRERTTQFNPNQAGPSMQATSSIRETSSSWFSQATWRASHRSR